MIIAFGHKAQTGKDTAGDYLVKNYGFTRIAFADKLKRMCSLLTGIPFEEFFGEAKHTYNEVWGMTHREMAQQMGTEAIRNGFHEDAWAIAALSNLDPNKDYVITDMRFPNEANFVRKYGGKLVRIDRDTKDYDIDRTHSSETSLDDFDDWDLILDNNGRLYEFYNDIDHHILTALS